MSDSCDRAERVSEVAARLRQLTGHMRFGVKGKMVEPDYKQWATLIVRDGWTITWAYEWISEGCPRPPAWMWSWTGKPATS